MVTARNPFVDDICLATPGEEVSGSVPIYGGMVERIVSEIPERDDEQGARVILLMAPRAGFGKTHLLSTVVDQIDDKCVPINVTVNPDSPLTWGGLFDQILTSYERPERDGSKVTRLDIAIRYLLARANRNLIDVGVVPCSNRWEADSALARDYERLFDFGDPTQVVAKWFGANFAKLLPHFGKELSSEAGLSVADCEQWLMSFCAYAESIGDAGAKRSDSLRWAMLSQSPSGVHVDGMQISSAGGGGEQEAKKRALAFCRLVSLHRPVVFLLDHLDGFYGDPDTGRKVAYFISELQQALPRKLTILSLNEDLWESSFKSGLPSAFEDRLTGNVVNLTGVDRGGARELVELRLEGRGVPEADRERFLGFLRLDDYFLGQAGKLISPRVVLRYAALHWDVFVGQESAAPPAEPFGTEEAEEAEIPDPFLVYPDEEEGERADGSVLGEGTQSVIAEAAGELGDAPDDEAEEEKRGGDGSAAKEEENPFQRLKGMLLKLREERGEKGGRLEVSQGEVLAAPDEPGTRPPESTADAAVLDEFHRAKKRIESELCDGGQPVGIDAEKIENLIRIAGRRFPVVSYDEFELPQSDGQEIVKWAFGGNEIYFGFEDGGHERFWLGLAEFVGARSGIRERRGDTSLKAKIVAFSEPGGEKAFHSIRNGDTPWDVICLDASALAALYAADELVRRAESGSLEAEPGQVLGILASQLDFFWRRVTRPKMVEPAKGF